MTTTITFIFFILGAIIGSFLNVVIFRFNTHKTLGGRSICLSCNNKLHWHDLVPLFSFLWLGGKCRNCKTGFSAQYFWVELLTGVIFASLFIKFSSFFYFASPLVFAFTFAFFATFFSLLLVVSVYDLKHKIIPDTFSIVLGIFGFIALFLFNHSEMALSLPSWQTVLAGFAISLPFTLIWYFSDGKWMGLGDAKMMLGVGWVLGLAGVLSGAVIAFWIGAILGIILLLANKSKFKINSELPFAPFLALGSFVAFLFSLNFFLI